MKSKPHQPPLHRVGTNPHVKQSYLAVVSKDIQPEGTAPADDSDKEEDDSIFDEHDDPTDHIDRKHFVLSWLNPFS